MEINRYISPVGNIFLAGKQGKLVGVWIEGQKYFAGSIREETVEHETTVLKSARLWLDCYFAGECPAIPRQLLAPEGSKFRRVIWDLLCEIPYGQAVTYGEMARRAAVCMGKERMSAQAVGGAVGHNPISIIIPCHRVVGADGNLTGYGGGIRKKIWLLDHEGVDLSRYYVPKKGTAL